MATSYYNAIFFPCKAYTAALPAGALIDTNTQIDYNIMEFLA